MLGTTSMRSNVKWNNRLTLSSSQSRRFSRFGMKKRQTVEIEVALKYCL
jgi:hypothetical protein